MSLNNHQVKLQKIFLNQPEGLNVILIINFFICLGACSFISYVNKNIALNIFSNTNIHILTLILFSSIFGCISSYFFGSINSIMYSIKFLVVASIFAMINNLSLFAISCFIVGISISIVNLQFKLNSFYLKNDSRRIYGFIAFYSSITFSVSCSNIINVYLHFNIKEFSHFYILLLIWLFIFFNKNNYKFNISNIDRNYKTSSFNIIFIAYILFSISVLIFIKNSIIFNMCICILFILAILYLIYLFFTKDINKKIAYSILFFSFIFLINIVTFISFISYQHIINNYQYIIYLSSLTFIVQCLFYLIIYFLNEKRIFKLNIDSFLTIKFFRFIFYFEILKILILLITIITNNNLNLYVAIIIFTITSILNIIIISIYFILAKEISINNDNEIFIIGYLYIILCFIFTIPYLCSLPSISIY